MGMSSRAPVVSLNGAVGTMIDDAVVSYAAVSAIRSPPSTRPGDPIPNGVVPMSIVAAVKPDPS